MGEIISLDRPPALFYNAKCFLKAFEVHNGSEVEAEVVDMWRHGDVLIARVTEVPEGATPRGNVILAYGEMTGHAHRIESPESAELWDHDGVIFMRIVSSSATIIHEEHKPITLPKGVYRVWKQREYSPGLIRDVWD